MTASLEQEIQSLQEIQGSEHDPGGRAFVHLADARRRNGELDEAVEIVEEGLERHPGFASAHVVAGWIRRDRGESDAAEAAFRSVLDLDEENTAALRGLGDVAEARGEVADALRWLKKLAGLVPEDRELADRIDDLERKQLAAEAEAFSELDGIMQEEAEVDEFAGMDSVGDAAELGEILGMSEEPEAEPPAPDEPEAELAEVEAPEDEVAELPGFDEPEAELGEVEEEVPGDADALAELEEMAGGFEVEEAPAPEADEPTLEADEPTPEADEPTDEEWEPEEGEDEEVLTATMGELYARQGLLDRAVEVFEQLVERRPDETRLQERLAELRERVAEGGATVGAAGEGEESVETLAREMASGEGAAGTLDTPFAWEGDEETAVAPVDDESGGPITGYFGRLLAWEPEGAAGLPEPGTVSPEAVPIESLAPDSDIVPIGSLAPDAVAVESLAPDAEAPVLTVDEDDEGPEPVVVIAESSGEAAGAREAVPIESLAPDGPSGGAGGAGSGGDEAAEGDEDFSRWLDRLK